jgi:hypothetical protein
MDNNMTCYTKYDIKSVFYSVKENTEFQTAIDTDEMQEILINRDITCDTKGENITYSILNNERLVEDVNETLRQTGTLKISKNFDTALLTNHINLVNAGMGKISSATKHGNVTVTGGTGSSVTPLLTTSTANIEVGNLIYTPDGLRVVTSIVANTSFQIDVPLLSAISGSTTLISYISCDLTNARGTCDKVFNFVVRLHDGRDIVMMGCNVRFDFAVTFEKQLSVTINVESASVYEDALTLTNTNDETKGTPVKCNFSESKFKNSSTITSYFPFSMELGYGITTEKIDAIGGLNNVVGYTNRSSIKPKLKLARSTSGKLIASYTNGVSLSLYQSNFGLYFQKLTFFNKNLSENHNNFDSISLECNANVEKDYKVYCFLPQ